MTETDYFLALQNLLDSSICQAPSVVGGHYEIVEQTQAGFVLHTKGLHSHKAIRLEKLRGGDWRCFKTPHNYAQKRCDSILVSWKKTTNGVDEGPIFLLVELKSNNAGIARKQLGASLAFCHFVHRMVCVGLPTLPVARFAAVTVLNMPFSLKTPSIPTLPDWTPPPLHVDCLHMRYDRSRGALPVAAVVAKI